MSGRKRIKKKISALIISMLLLAGLVYIAGARNGREAFCYYSVTWISIKLYVTIVLNCGWYVHTRKAWIAGTEDLEEKYRNYKFYLSSIPRSIIAGGIVALMVGFLIELIC